MVRREVLKQYRDLAKNLKSFSQGQATLVQDDQDGDSLKRVRIDISPSSGPYRAGRFKFELELSESYPEQAPRILCLNSVYHPNIEVLDRFSDAEVCINLLDKLWTPQRTLEDCVQGLLYIFHNPNLKDPFSAAFFTERVGERDFLRNVRRSMRGGYIGEFRYDRVLAEDYVSEDEDERKGLDGFASDSDDQKSHLRRELTETTGMVLVPMSEYYDVWNWLDGFPFGNRSIVFVPMSNAYGDWNGSDRSTSDSDDTENDKEENSHGEQPETNSTSGTWTDQSSEVECLSEDDDEEIREVATLHGELAILSERNHPPRCASSSGGFRNLLWTYLKRLLLPFWTCLKRVLFALRRLATVFGQWLTRQW